jgi:hypothetical protein
MSGWHRHRDRAGPLTPDKTCEERGLLPGQKRGLPGHQWGLFQATDIEVDAATADRSTVVEAYARQGKLKGAQLKKIAQDILKLALLKRQPGHERTETIIAFASQEAHDSISGWLQEAAAEFGV